jgi:putative acetyltransferase
MSAFRQQHGVSMIRKAYNNLVIRAARPEDAGAVSRVQNAAVRRIPEGSPSKVVAAWSGAGSPASVRRNMALGVVGFVAEIDGEIAGFAVLAGNVVRVVCVHPDHSGSGLGTALLDRVEEEAMRRGQHILRLSASQSAKPFYRSRGYNVVRENTRQLPLDECLPCVEMAKTIAS